MLFPGVTGYLGVINKPALIPWARNEALACVERALLLRLENEYGIELNGEIIREIIAEAKKRPDKIKDDAADLGTLVHKYIDQIIQGEMPPDLTPEMEPAVAAFIEWWQKSKIELVRGDTKVASIIHKYGGSLDALGRLDGEYVILDWKTGNGIYNEYALQVAAYANALWESYGIVCKRGFIIRFSKKLPITFDVAEITSLEKSFQIFLAAKNLKEGLDREQFL